MVNDHYRTRTAKVIMITRNCWRATDIDAVMIAVPDHWHELVATEAARRKKDVYGEKPLAQTIAEQQAIVRAVEKNKIIWQMGSWQRSVPTFHKAAEIVRNGLIGTSRTLKSVCPPAGRIFPARAKRLWKKSPRCRTRSPTFQKSRPARPRGTCWPRIRRRNWITTPGSARPRWSIISRRVRTKTGAGITTRAAAN